MEFIMTAWQILSDDKYSMVETAWKLAIEAQDHQWALAGAPVGTPLVCQLPSSPSHKIDPQTQQFLWGLIVVQLSGGLVSG
jgi:hypothetical protein